MAQLLALVLGFLPLAVNLRAAYPYEPIKIWTFQITVVVALLATAAVWFWSREIWKSRRAALRVGALDYALLGFTTALALGTVFSENPRLSFFGASERLTGLLYYTACVGLYVLLRVWGVKEKAWRLFVTATAFVVYVEGVSALLQIWNLDPSGFSRAFLLYGDHGPVRVFGTLGHPNFLGAYLALVGPYLLAAAKEAIARRELRRAVFFGVAIAIAIGTTLATYSRGAYAALLIGAISTGIFLANTKRERRMAFGAAITVCTLLLLAMWGTESDVFHRVKEMASFSSGSGLARREEWKFGMRLLKDRPLLGYGMETYVDAAAFRQKSDAEKLQGAASPDPSVADRLHNIWLDTMWGSGIVGLFALIMLFGVGMHAASSALKMYPGSTRISAALGSIVAYLVVMQSGFDYSVSAPLLMWSFASIANQKYGIMEQPDARDGVGP